MNDVDYTPVKDPFGPNGNKETYDNDVQAKKFDQERHVISQWARDDLEDKYLRLWEDNFVLKKHARKQEDKIKKLAAKLLRLVNDKKKNAGGRHVESEDRVEELQQQVSELDRQNRMLKDKLQISKQQLASQGKRHTPYDRVQPRIKSGVTKSGPTAHEQRIKSSTRVLSPHGRTAESARLTSSGGMPRYGHSLLEDARHENRRLEQIIAQLHEQLNMKEMTIEELNEKVRIKEAEFEEDVLRIKQQASVGQRVLIQENMDLIKLQRELKEKSSMLTAIHAKYQSLESKMATAEASHAQLLLEMDRMNADLKMREQQNLQLEANVKQMNSTQRRVIELEHMVEDLKRDNTVLKGTNDQLTNTAFDTAREREWREKEQALRAQIAQLEATMKRDVSEKGDVLTRLEAERDKSDLTEQELSGLRVRFYELQQAHEELQDKMKFFTKVVNSREDGTGESAVDFSEVEEALVLVKQKRERGSQNLEFLTKVDEASNYDTSKKLQEANAAHAETIQELEKTRSMLIVQYKINNDYKRELDSLTSRHEQEQAEMDLKLTEYAKLLDIRASRIRKLQSQLKDVAYGTRQFRVTATDEAEETESVAEDSVALQRGENMVEIHVGKLSLNDRGAALLGEEEPQLFCTWDFYEFETQATAVLRGPAVDFDLTAQYAVRVDDFFLHYLQKDAAVLELHLVVGSEYRTIAACRLSCKALLDSKHGRIYATEPLIAVDHDGGLSLGAVEYWVRLRVPMDQALRLYRERTKALGYLNANERATGEALKALDEAAERRPADNVNNLHVKLVRCEGLKSRRLDVQPSTYCVYKFFDFPDHDSAIIPSSQAPVFHDHKTFPVHMTPDLDRYVKTQPLIIFVFDDTDPDEASYLGRACVPLIPLSHNKLVSGIFELNGPDGQPSGVIEVEIRWQFDYLPAPLAERTAALEATAAAMAKGPKPPAGGPASVELLPGEDEEISNATPLRPERDSGPHPEVRRAPLKAPREKVAASPQPIESPPLVPIQRTTKSILKRPEPRKEGTVADRLKQLPADQMPRLDDVEIPDGDSNGGRPETHEPAVRSKDQVPAPHVNRASNRQEAMRSSMETLERLQPSEMSSLMVTERSSESATVTSVTKENSDAVGFNNNAAVSESSTNELTPLPVGTNHRDPIVPPRRERDGASENGSDSDVVVVHNRTSRELRDSGGTLSGTLTNTADPCDTVVIEVAHLQIDDEAELLQDPQVKLLYIDYRFLGQTIETPFSIPKSALKDTDNKLNFNFRKTFSVNFEEHYQQRQLLAGMLLKDYPGCTNFISFTVLSEPPDDQSGDCEELGFANFDIRGVLRQNRDVENIDLRVEHPDDPEKTVGHLCVSVRCLAALQSIREEIQGVDFDI